MTLEKLEKNRVLKLSFDFALSIIKFSMKLDADKRFHLSRQLFKSGTAIGANIIEAQNSESRADFIHKLKIAAKEAEETQYWLWLCEFSFNYADCGDLLKTINEINRLLGSIISKTKKAA